MIEELAENLVHLKKKNLQKYMMAKVRFKK